MEHGWKIAEKRSERLAAEERARRPEQALLVESGAALEPDVAEVAGPVWEDFEEPVDEYEEPAVTGAQALWGGPSEEGLSAWALNGEGVVSVAETGLDDSQCIAGGHANQRYGV